jgi:Ala-tRNA(Pro) deacylase
MGGIRDASRRSIGRCSTRHYTLVPTPMTPPVLERLKAKLTQAGVPFQVQHHEPVFTSEQAAAVRGTTLASGAKALVLKVDAQTGLFVLPADRRLDNKKLRTALNARIVRFATADEVLGITGLRPGSIPPFGSLFDLTTYCDPALAANETINFNAGDHSVSISIAYSTFVAVEAPRMLEFTTVDS